MIATCIVTSEKDMFRLFKDQLLGIGSYGAVCKAKSGEVLCAAKIINPNLLDPAMMYRIPNKQEEDEKEGTEKWTTTRWFEQESEFLFKLQHPNLVQYLALYQDPDTCLPVLLMELMADNLTHYLRTPGPIPYHFRINICHDIAQALSFLHSSNVIHKNLCSNNVLLTDQGRAKVTDFGMATLAGLNPQTTTLPFMAIQDKLVYMPPEAVREKPVYTEKMDCFSFGVIVVQILTRQLPKPGDCWKCITVKHPGLLKDICIPVAEVESQKDHIDLIDESHSLLPIALECLKDMAIERPSAKQLCKRLVALKESSGYNRSVKSAKESEQRTEQTFLDSKDRQIVALQAKVERLTKELAERDCVIAKSQEEAEKLSQKHYQEVASLQEKLQSQVMFMEKIPEQTEQQSKEGHHDKENVETKDESRVVSNMAAANNDDLKGKIDMWCCVLMLSLHVYWFY